METNKLATGENFTLYVYRDLFITGDVGIHLSIGDPSSAGDAM